MSEAEHTEYLHLINLWNCTEPMTDAQIERMNELEKTTMTINSKPQTAEQLLAMLIPDSKPDPLTAARARLAKACEAYDEALENRDCNADEMTQLRRQLRLAREKVEAIETAALKGMRK